ncbi:MAG TPA: ABC transporter permease [Vicinamibacterales bacterium]|nr:ABC transporter permease [Vicinamibacterales bacterium]
MNRMRRWIKIQAIATFEFLAVVKRPGYLITTFGMPVFMAIYAGVVALPAYYATQKDHEAALYGVVDRADVLHLSGDATSAQGHLPAQLRDALEAAGQQAAIQRIEEDATVTFRPFVSEADARRALLGRRVKGYFVLPPDYLRTGAVESYTPDAVDLSSADPRDDLGTLVRERLVAGRVDGGAAARILAPVGDMHRFAVTRTGEVRDGGKMASAVRLVVPLAFMVLFLMSILMTSGYLMQGTAIEKENKVVEVLLSSANPDEILAGKLVGLGGAGLLQICIWLSIVLLAGLGIGPMLMAAHIDVPWTTIALALPLFVLSFLFFGSLILGTGSLGSTMREAQQLAMVWSLTAALPLITMGLLIKDPHGLVARVLTWLPFTSGALVVLRSSMDPGALAWWEVAGAVLVLCISIWGALRMGARLFRVGLLNAGARPSWREVIRQARLATP